jgi:hypothetical protein
MGYLISSVDSQVASGCNEATKDDLASFPIDRHHSDNRYDVEHAAGLGRLMWASTREVG